MWRRGWVRSYLQSAFQFYQVAQSVWAVKWLNNKKFPCWEINFLSENKEAKGNLLHNVSPKHGLGSSAQLWRYHDPPGALRQRHPECPGLRPAASGPLLPRWGPRTASSKWPRATDRLKLTWRSWILSSRILLLIRMTTIESLLSLKITSNISPVLHLQRM